MHVVAARRLGANPSGHGPERLRGVAGQRHTATARWRPLRSSAISTEAQHVERVTRRRGGNEPSDRHRLHRVEIRDLHRRGRGRDLDVAHDRWPGEVGGERVVGAVGVDRLVRPEGEGRDPIGVGARRCPLGDYQRVHRPATDTGDQRRVHHAVGERVAVSVGDRPGDGRAVGQRCLLRSGTRGLARSGSWLCRRCADLGGGGRRRSWPSRRAACR